MEWNISRSWGAMLISSNAGVRFALIASILLAGCSEAGKRAGEIDVDAIQPPLIRVDGEHVDPEILELLLRAHTGVEDVLYDPIWYVTQPRMDVEGFMVELLPFSSEWRERLGSKSNTGRSILSGPHPSEEGRRTCVRGSRMRGCG